MHLRKASVVVGSVTGQANGGGEAVEAMGMWRGRREASVILNVMWVLQLWL